MIDQDVVDPADAGSSPALPAHTRFRRPESLTWTIDIIEATISPCQRPVEATWICMAATEPE